MKHLLYADPNHRSEIWVELPLGSYIPQFRQPAPEPVAVEVLPNIRPQEVATEPGRPVRVWQKRSLWLALPITLALLFFFRGALGWQQNDLDQFWNPVFVSTKPVLICLGSRFGGRSVPDNPQRDASLASDPLMRPVTMMDAVTLARLTDYIGGRHATYRILNPDATTLADLRDSPAILIGVRNNDWAIKSAGKLRFSLDVTSRPVAIRDSQNPSRSWSATPGLSGLESGRDYAIVYRVADPGVEQVIVTVGALVQRHSGSSGVRDQRHLYEETGSLCAALVAAQEHAGRDFDRSDQG